MTLDKDSVSTYSFDGTSALPIAALIALVVLIPSACRAAGIQFPSEDKVAVFLAAEMIACACWAAARLGHPWPRWHALLYCFTAIATSFEASVLCDYVGQCGLSYWVAVMIGGMAFSDKAARSYLFYERGLTVRMLAVMAICSLH